MKRLVLIGLLALGGCLPEERKPSPEQAAQDAHVDSIYAAQAAQQARYDAHLRDTCSVRGGVWLEGGKWGESACFDRKAILFTEEDAPAAVMEHLTK